VSAFIPRGLLGYFSLTGNRRPDECSSKQRYTNASGTQVKALETGTEINLVAPSNMEGLYLFAY
jgi:hypothetical protein